MRVVGGSARGSILLVVPGDGTRPILDRVKTASSTSCARELRAW